MARPEIPIYMIGLGPEVPLGRRGCSIEEAKSIEKPEGWEGTHFYTAIEENYVKTIKFLKTNGEEISTVLRKIEQNKIKEKLLDDLTEMKAISKISDNKYKLSGPIEQLGTLFECYTSLALLDQHIKTKRDVKIKYPYPDNPYDPDGQKYDVLGGLDLTKLIWIECKKPLYMGGKNPLKNVLSPENIQKYYRRAHFLRPNIAVFLVDTKKNYIDYLRNIFTEEFITSGCYVEYNSSLTNISARLHGFIYFAYINYKDNKDYYKAINRTICQILHDARHDYPYIGFSNNVFRGNVK